MSIKIYKDKIKCLNALKIVCDKIINDYELFQIINRQVKLDVILVDTYPNKKWNLNKVNIDENMTDITDIVNIIEKYPDKKWNWKSISRNERLFNSLVEKYPDKDWDWKYVSRYEDIKIDIIEKYPDKDWNWRVISRNERLVKRLIGKYPDKDWDIEYILAKTTDYGCMYEYELKYRRLEGYEKNDLELIKGEKKYKNDKNYMNNLIKVCINKNIKLPKLSSYEDLDINLVYDNLDKDWDFDEVFINHDINFSKIKPYIAELNIDVEVLSTNRGLTMNDIKENMDLGWDMWAVSEYNPNITMDFIKSNPGLIDMQALLRNYNAPDEFIEKNLINNGEWISLLCRYINIHSNFIMDFNKISINEITMDINKKLSTDPRDISLLSILKCIKHNQKIIDKRTNSQKILNSLFPNEISDIIILYI